MTALERLVERRGGDQAARQFARWRATNLIDQTISRLDGRRVNVAGQWLPNFASCDYLGLGLDLRIAAACCSGTRRGVSLGLPRTLASDPLTDRVETSITRLVGQERALVFPSTLHAASDVLPLLAGPHGVIFIDERAYPISLAACRLAQRSGATLRVFTHNDPRALHRLLTEFIHIPDKVIVCDGVYVSGEIARLDRFVSLAQEHDAVLYVDDAHGIGVLGARSGTLPLGRGGAGTPAYCGVRTGNLVHVGGLSKAFGVPIAFVAGPRRFIRYLKHHAATYMHSSQPATPVLAAALAALDVDTREGDARRHALSAMIARFSDGLVAGGLLPEGETALPVQSISISSVPAAIELATALRRRGLWMILQLEPPEAPAGGTLRFLLSAAHRVSDIDLALRLLRESSAGGTRPYELRRGFAGATPR